MVRVVPFHYTGKVWCLRVPTGAFVAVRNGVAFPTGNSGFPKSLDVSKAIDKAAGAERKVVGTKLGLPGYSLAEDKGRNTYSADGRSSEVECAITAPATDAARQWAGWGTALKPAIEPIVVARKPLIGTVASNILAHGTGALNIDACRVEAVDETDAQGYSAKCASVVGLASNINGNAYGEFAGARQDSAHELGRFPANLIHDGSPEVVALFPDSAGAGGSTPNVKITGYGSGIGTGESEYLGGPRTKVNSGSGSASRFFKQVSFDEEDIEAAALFFCAKASRKDRNEGCEGMPAVSRNHEDYRREINTSSGKPRGDVPRQNTHPTVKPTDLMRYLCRLVTPPGGVVVDPFTGSGTTGKAAMLEGFRFIGCELMPEYAQIARARISHAWEAAQPTPEIDDDQQLDLFPVELRKCSAM